MKSLYLVYILFLFLFDFFLFFILIIFIFLPLHFSHLDYYFLFSHIFFPYLYLLANHNYYYLAYFNGIVIIICIICIYFSISCLSPLEIRTNDTLKSRFSSLMTSEMPWNRIWGRNGSERWTAKCSCCVRFMSFLF